MRTNHARFEHLLRTVTNLERAYEIAVTLVDSLIETHISMQQADANELHRKQEKAEREGNQEIELIAVLFLSPTLVLTFLSVDINGSNAAFYNDVNTTEGVEVWSLSVMTAISFVLALVLAANLHRVLRSRAYRWLTKRRSVDSPDPATSNARTDGDPTSLNQ